MAKNLTHMMSTIFWEVLDPLVLIWDLSIVLNPRNLPYCCPNLANPPMRTSYVHAPKSAAASRHPDKSWKYFEAGSGQVKREQVKTSRNHGEIFWNVGIFGRISMVPTGCHV